MEAILASSLAKVTSTASLAKASGAVSGSVLVGLKSMPPGLTLPSSAVLGSAALASAVLGSAASTVGSLLGKLHVSYLLDPPAKALTAYLLGAKAAAAIIGGVVAVAAVPVVLGTMGFTGAGIAASSLAAKMMSVAAIANGGGVAAGSLVATLQSVGAAGLSMPSKIFLGSVGSALASLMV
ncbi:interferon alpha-inducible protein 27, mitochondrial isoform X1 [Desmodus rotundus]|uniref:interferon alpha-inducible protein 27, mitochondrial isoform X1 n=1 Tax=Desmodus rotundus TaxID=9430 RepID=UPI00238112B5|nr:interferon alpha-inducible protein 27, mitochondrial isoform X1 [Desmodus rotundus]